MLLNTCSINDHDITLTHALMKTERNTVVQYSVNQDHLTETDC